MRGVCEQQKTIHRRIQDWAIKQVAERRYSVADVAKRLGTTTHSLHAWIKCYGEKNPQQSIKADIQAENAKFKAELRYVTEERDILKKTAKYFANDPG